MNENNTLGSGVLFTDHKEDENYHILSGGHTWRDVLVADRSKRSIPKVYAELYRWCKKLGIGRLWIMPDTQLSIWTNRADFNLIPKGMNWFSPERKADDRDFGDHPFCLRLHDRYIFFPAYGNLLRKNKPSQVWNLPDYKVLADSVLYLEQSTGHPFLWSPGYSSKSILRGTHIHRDIKPFEMSGLWHDIVRGSVTRPMWSHRLYPDGKRGLTDTQKRKKYIIAGDKNGSFLGAANSLELGNGGEYTIIGQPECEVSWFHSNPGFYQYTLQDVSGSWFNGYDMYCPLSTRDTWASTELLRFAYEMGIKFEVTKGFVARNKLSRPLRKWAEILRDAIEALQNKEVYTDEIARVNALGTVKKYYLDMIGQFNREYSDEYFHPEWNLSVVHQSIARLGYSMRLREQILRGNVILVSNDQFYLLSDSPDPYQDYSSFFTDAKLVKGYKPIGVYPLTEETIETFETEHSVTKLEYAIEKAGNVYVTSR